jgi:hypothetical protein
VSAAKENPVSPGKSTAPLLYSAYGCITGIQGIHNPLLKAVNPGQFRSRAYQRSFIPYQDLPVFKGRVLKSFIDTNHSAPGKDLYISAGHDYKDNTGRE